MTLNKAPLLAICVLLMQSAPAWGVKLQLTEEAFLDFRVLLQPQAQLRENGAATGKDASFDFYLRRARLILSGAASKNITFFVDTDMPNLGKGGKFDVDFILQDAFASFKVVPELIIDAGFIIAPLTHHSVQSAASLNTLDYHSFLVKYPAGSNKVWRDAGLQLRGIFLNNYVQYRVGAFGGVRSQGGRKDAAGNALPDINPRSIPRFAGQVRLNVFDPEPDFFFAGTYLRNKKVLSFGFAADFQPAVSAVGSEVHDYVAIGGDVFLDLPLLQASELVFQANLINYWQGELSPSTGLGLFAEAGWRWKWIGPVVSFERFISRTGAGHYQAWRLGLNWWISQHTANVKADVAFEQDSAAQKKTRLADTKTVTVFTLQTQLFF